MGIDAIKIFSELVGGYLKFWKTSVFWDYLESPSRYISTLGNKKFSTHDKKNLDELFFDPPFLKMEGWGEICIFRLFELSGDPVEIN